MMDEEFLARLRNDFAFRNLPSEQKIKEYRQKGATIEEGVQLGQGSVVIAKKIYLGRGVRIGPNSYIEADSLVLKPMVWIGSANHLVSGEIEIGEGTLLAEKVKVDLSGGRDSSSALIVGRQCLLAMETYVNTCRRVVMGDRSALSPRAMVFTHSFWQSVLDGYSVVFSAVEIASDAWVGAGAQLFAGVRLGQGSIVMSNSLVVNNVDDHVLVGGVPAAVIKRNLKKELSPLQRQTVLEQVITDFLRWLKQRGLAVEDFIVSGAKGAKILAGAKEHRLIYSTGSGPMTGHFSEGTVIVSMEPVRGLPAEVEIFDLAKGEFVGTEGPLAHELRNFLRRRGIRFAPFDWQYCWDKGLFQGQE